MSSLAGPRGLDPRWRLAVGLAAVLVGVFVYRLAGSSSVPAAAPPLGANPQQAVTLRVVRPDAEPQELESAWTDGLTVADATRGALRSEWRGEGPMAFLQSLDGVPNQGADGLNWQFEVNGEYADKGAGAYPLAPGDRVLWKLAPYE